MLGKSSNCTPGRAPDCSREWMIQVTECLSLGLTTNPPSGVLRAIYSKVLHLKTCWSRCFRKQPMAVHWQPPYTAAPKARGRTAKETVRCKSPKPENAQMLWELSIGGCKEGWGWQVLVQMKGMRGLAYGASTLENSMARWSPGWDQSHKLLRDCSFWFYGTGTQKHCIFHNQFMLDYCAVRIAEKSQ